MIKPIFITTFFLLFIGGVLFFYNDQNKSTNYQNTSQGKQKLLEKLDTKELNSINILSDGSYVSLIQLKGGVWEEKSMKYQADITSIQDLLLTITQIKLGDLVTNNAEHHERFKLLEPPEIVADLNKDFHGNSISQF